MNAYQQFIHELADDIEKSVHSHDWKSVDADLTALCEQFVGALIERRDDDLRGTYDRVEKVYSVLAAQFGPRDGSMDAQGTTAELQGYTRLLAIALEHRRIPDPRVAAYEGTNRKILFNLLGEPRGLSGRDLASKVQVAPETIARKLPELRAARLVESWKAGKATMNTLTEDGKRMAQMLRLLESPDSGMTTRPLIKHAGTQFARINQETAKRKVSPENAPAEAAYEEAA